MRMNLLKSVWVLKNWLKFSSFFLLISFWWKVRVQEIRFIWKQLKNWETQWEKKDCMEGISQKRKAKEKKKSSWHHEILRKPLEGNAVIFIFQGFHLALMKIE